MAIHDRVRNKRFLSLFVIIFLTFGLIGISLFYSFAVAQTGTAVISGTQRQWHKVTLTWDGPNTSETAAPNPFLDYRLDVTFTNGGTTYIVPGYYCADGNASETSATSGNKWCVHFAPDKVGTWTYTASFTTGNKVAIDGGGASAGFFDGDTGTFNIGPTDKTGRDFRARGRAKYVGEHYLQHQGTGDYLVKMGADAPESAFCYDDFDDTRTGSPQGPIDWSPHQQDYQASEAGVYTWQGGKGSELLGVVAYLHDKGVNAISFLTFSLSGDSDCVSPHLALSGPPQSWNDVDHLRFDISKMGQWERIMQYADQKGVFLHFKTMETENDQLMDWDERRLYYRMLIARYSHHLALNWNLSEEISINNTLIKDTLDYIEAVDPYDHLRVFHTFPSDKARYDNFLGNQSSLTGASLQTSPTTIHDEVIDFVSNSAAAGVKWVVANDEQTPANVGVDVDTVAGSREKIRRDVIWGVLMAGGAGAEFYYGYGTGCTDLNCGDHRTRDQKYTDAGYALKFFNEGNNGGQIPFWLMSSNDNALSGEANDDGWVFEKPGEVYVVYLADANPSGTLTVVNGTYSLRWYDPRAGQFVGSPVSQSGSSIPLGSPPNAVDEDWVALLLLESVGPTPTPTTFVTPTPTPYASPTPTGTPGPDFFTFDLINTATDQPLSALTEGMQVLQGDQLSVEAIPQSSVGSVQFSLITSGQPEQVIQTENVSPYAAAGDSGGDFAPWGELNVLGDKTLIARAYSGSNAGGTLVGSTSRSFTVVDSIVPTATPTPGGLVPPTLTISKAASVTTLSWNPENAACTTSIYRSDSMPYSGFVAWRTAITGTSSDISTDVGQSGTRRFYHLFVDCGSETAVSNTVGALTMPLTPGN